MWNSKTSKKRRCHVRNSLCHILSSAYKTNTVYSNLGKIYIFKVEPKISYRHQKATLVTFMLYSLNTSSYNLDCYICVQ